MLPWCTAATADGDRYQDPAAPGRHIFVPFVAILGVGVVLGAIGALGALSLDVFRPVPGAHVSAGVSRAVSQTPASTAQFAVDSTSTIQAPVSVAIVGFASADPVNWDEIAEVTTTDDNHGGKFQWDSKTQMIRVCDTHRDGLSVIGHASITRPGDSELTTTQVVASETEGRVGDCSTTHVSFFDTENVPLNFRVCLFNDSQVKKYCSTTNNVKWSELDTKKKDDKDDNDCDSMPPGLQEECERNKKEDECDDLPTPAQKYCRDDNDDLPYQGPELDLDDLSQKPDVPKPPDGYSPKINAESPSRLSKHADNRPPLIDKATARIVGWVVWVDYGSGIAGIMIIGINMTIQHKRGEVRSHFHQLGVVLFSAAAPGAAIHIVWVFI